MTNGTTGNSYCIFCLQFIVWICLRSYLSKKLTFGGASQLNHTQYFISAFTHTQRHTSIHRIELNRKKKKKTIKTHKGVEVNHALGQSKNSKRRRKSPLTHTKKYRKNTIRSLNESPKKRDTKYHQKVALTFIVPKYMDLNFWKLQNTQFFSKEDQSINERKPHLCLCIFSRSWYHVEHANARRLCLAH